MNTDDVKVDAVKDSADRVGANDSDVTGEGVVNADPLINQSSAISKMVNAKVSSAPTSNKEIMRRIRQSDVADINHIEDVIRALNLRDDTPRHLVKAILRFSRD